jgi:dTMP kinase
MASQKQRPTGKKHGLFVVFEGGDGVGKSTQIRHLLKWLKKGKHPFLFTRQPGGTPIGKKIRAILLNPDFTNLSPQTELLLYEADRAQNVQEVILPALEAGKIVLSDRFADSSTVYQGICRGLGRDWVEKLNLFATAGKMPDIVFLLDLPEHKGRARIQARKLDRIENESSDFHRRVQRGFLTLARREPRRFVVIDASREPEVIAKKIQAILAKRMGWKHE